MTDANRPSPVPPAVAASVLLACLALAGCTHTRRLVVSPPPAGSFTLELAGEYEMPKGATVGPDRLMIGGVSGLVLDRRTGTLLAVCDSGSQSRVFELAVHGEGPTFSVEPTGVIRLGSGPAAPAALDPESIALASDGALVIGSEGNGDRQPRVPPGILVYERSGRFAGELPVPEKFIPNPTGALTRGVRRNEAFESLTMSPSGIRLFTGVESPLAQDGDAATVEHGAHTRVLEFTRASDGSWRPGREFIYPLDPIAGLDVKTTFEINGLVELLALSDTELLALERSYAQAGDGRQRNSIRLYRFSTAGATDVSTAGSLEGAVGARAVEKRLVLDLSDLTGLSENLAGLDNFEGLALGPRLRDGSASLLMVSDDNFNVLQHTAFLLFRIVPAAGTP